MSVKRVAEKPRVTMPFSDESWDELLKLGDAVDADLSVQGVGLTMGGEPTFVSIDQAGFRAARLGAVNRA